MSTSLANPELQEPIGPVTYLGRRAQEVMSDTVGILDLFMQTLRFLGQAEFKHVVQQVYLIGNKSLFFVSIIMGFPAFAGDFHRREWFPDRETLHNPQW